MKRSHFFAIFFLSVLYFAPAPVKAAALRAEAVFGEPFGVCRIELPLSSTEQEMDKSYDNPSFFEMIHQASVHEGGKRALYPAWKSGGGKKTLLFLFQAQDELDVIISRTGFDEFTEKVK
ncbi:MAG: hypothetical protein FWG09_06595, partial [Synergistaceae bacterium]|nr:hypothetical protein [Synergistaceae bacterium]